MIEDFEKEGETSFTAIERKHELNDEFSGLFGFHSTFAQAKFFEGKLFLPIF